MADSPFIIFLNGTSSSGKSSIAACIQELWDIPFLHLQLDSFLTMVSLRHLGSETTEWRHNWNAQNIVTGFHHCIDAMLRAGNYLIVDHVLQEPQWLLECLSLLKEHKVYFVGVHCSLEVLHQREQERGDRQPGLAAMQLPRVHAHQLYDLEVHTDQYSSKQCAEQILEYVRNHKSPTVWQQLL